MSRQELPPEFAHLEPLMRTLPEGEEKNWENFIKDEFDKGEQVLADPSFPPELRRRMTDFIGSLHYIDTMLASETKYYPASGAKLSHQVFERIKALKGPETHTFGELIEEVAKRRGVTVEEVSEGAKKFYEGPGKIYATPEDALFIYCVFFGAGGDPLKD